MTGGSLLRGWRRHGASGGMGGGVAGGRSSRPEPGGGGSSSTCRSPRRRPENIVHQTINNNSASASSASSNSNPMAAAYRSATARSATAAATIGLLTALLLAGCVGVAPPLPPAGEPVATAPATGRARWVAVPWSELPGWDGDRSSEAWGALWRSCERPGADWRQLCAQLLLAGPPADDAALRQWLMRHLQPYRIEAADAAGTAAADGLITGYYEPLIDASRTPVGAYRVPLYGVPPDLASRKPYWTRQQIDTMPAAQAALRGREIAYVADPLDALVLQIQGSGRLRLVDPAAAPTTVAASSLPGVAASLSQVRVAYAGHNDQPYRSVGRWLIDQGELRADQASWPAIRDWTRRNPKRINELLWSNPRFVFFREEGLNDPDIGPRGAQGVPLTPQRSIAVDPRSVPYGTPIWLDTTEPLSSSPLRRLVVAQDTGSAIVGAVRADFFWGAGAVAEQQAGRMKQRLRMWALWPQGSVPRAAR